MTSTMTDRSEITRDALRHLVERFAVDQVDAWPVVRAIAPGDLSDDALVRAWDDACDARRMAERLARGQEDHHYAGEFASLAEAIFHYAQATDDAIEAIVDGAA